MIFGYYRPISTFIIIKHRIITNNDLNKSLKTLNRKTLDHDQPFHRSPPRTPSPKLRILFSSWSQLQLSSSSSPTHPISFHSSRRFHSRLRQNLKWSVQGEPTGWSTRGDCCSRAPWQLLFSTVVCSWRVWEK